MAHVCQRSDGRCGTSPETGFSSATNGGVPPTAAILVQLESTSLRFVSAVVVIIGSSAVEGSASSLVMNGIPHTAVISISGKQVTVLLTVIDERLQNAQRGVVDPVQMPRVHTRAQKQRDAPPALITTVSSSVRNL